MLLRLGQRIDIIVYAKIIIAKNSDGYNGRATEKRERFKRTKIRIYITENFFHAAHKKPWL